MHRTSPMLITTLILTVLGQLSSADESRSARQRFVVHVPPKISFESAEVPPAQQTAGPSDANADASEEKIERAFRLGGTSAAGITAWVEVESGTSSIESSVPDISLHIASDEKGQWTVTSWPAPQGTVLQATSTGAGAATLVISSDPQTDETVIVTTIISND